MQPFSNPLDFSGFLDCSTMKGGVYKISALDQTAARATDIYNRLHPIEDARHDRNIVTSTNLKRSGRDVETQGDRIGTDQRDAMRVYDQSDFTGVQYKPIMIPKRTHNNPTNTRAESSVVSANSGSSPRDILLIPNRLDVTAANELLSNPSFRTTRLLKVKIDADLTKVLTDGDTLTGEVRVETLRKRLIGFKHADNGKRPIIVSCKMSILCVQEIRSTKTILDSHLLLNFSSTSLRRDLDSSFDIFDDAITGKGFSLLPFAVKFPVAFGPGCISTSSAKVRYLIFL